MYLPVIVFNLLLEIISTALVFRFLVPVCDLLILNNICKYNWHYPVFKIGVLFRNGLFRLSITLNVLLTIYKVLCSYRQKNLQQIDNPANITKKL